MPTLASDVFEISFILIVLNLSQCRPLHNTNPARWIEVHSFHSSKRVIDTLAQWTLQLVLRRPVFAFDWVVTGAELNKCQPYWFRRWYSRCDDVFAVPFTKTGGWDKSLEWLQELLELRLTICVGDRQSNKNNCQRWQNLADWKCWESRSMRVFACWFR